MQLKEFSNFNRSSTKYYDIHSDVHSNTPTCTHKHTYTWRIIVLHVQKKLLLENTHTHTRVGRGQYLQACKLTPVLRVFTRLPIYTYFSHTLHTYTHTRARAHVHAQKRVKKIRFPCMPQTCNVFIPRAVYSLLYFVSFFVSYVFYRIVSLLIYLMFFLQTEIQTNKQ